MAKESADSRNRNEHGQYADRIPTEAALAVFEDRNDRARPLTADDVMAALECSRRTAHNKLNELVDQGVLRTRKVGARGRVWWVPINREREEETESRLEAVRLAIEDVELPGTGETLQARREALLAAYDYLRDNPTAKKADFLREVFPDNPAGYETAEGWWNTIQPALKQLPGVDPPEERGHIWHFLGG